MIKVYHKKMHSSISNSEAVISLSHFNDSPCIKKANMNSESDPVGFSFQNHWTLLSSKIHFLFIYILKEISSKSLGQQKLYLWPMKVRWVIFLLFFRETQYDLFQRKPIPVELENFFLKISLIWIHETIKSILFEYYVTIKFS